MKSKQTHLTSKLRTMSMWKNSGYLPYNYFIITGPSNDVCHTVDNKPCQFPFRYNGVSYSTCTLKGADDVNSPWCSTLVDNNGNHVSGGGHYGNCGSKCPLSGRSGSSINSLMSEIIFSVEVNTF